MAEYIVQHVHNRTYVLGTINKIKTRCARLALRAGEFNSSMSHEINEVLLW
jgi:hypothetical protein